MQVRSRSGPALLEDGIKRRLVVSVLVALGAILITWLILGESSPFDDYFSTHTAIPNLWRMLNALPFIAGGVLSGNHGGSPLILFTVLQFIQWFIIGFVASTLLSIVFRRR